MTEEEVNKTAYKRSGVVNHTKKLLTLHFFSRPYAFSGSKSLYKLENNNILERDAVSETRAAASGFSLVLASLSY